MSLRSDPQRRMRRHSSKQLAAALCISAFMLAAAGVSFGRRSEAGVAGAAAAPVIAPEFDIVRLPVPAAVVPAGARVRDIRFKMVSFPRHQVPQGALESLDGLTESAAVAPLPANLPIFAENFSAQASANNPVVERIPPGMRAMTVRVDATSSVEGWAGSGSIVDVLLIEKERTAVVAEKVKILSAERSVSPVEGSSSPNVPSTVTLLVTQEQCLAINTAVPLGHIAFALRSSRDEAAWMTTSFSAQRLRERPQAAAQDEIITGFASVQDAEAVRSYALSEGRWVRSESVPDGFFPAREAER